MSSFYSIPGPAGTIQIGTVTTGAEGTNATVTNTGTAESAILNFQIPRGNTGTVSTAVLGSAASPSITFIGDTNTGIYSPGADQLALSTNGQGRLFVDASGNVGIGVSPATPLDTVGTFQWRSNVGGTDKWQRFTGGAGLIYDGTTTNTAIGFLTNGTERLRITSTGQLSHIGAGSSGSPAVSFSGSAASNSLVVDSSSRVGIGTSSPVDLLQLGGATNKQLRIDSSSSPVYVGAFAGTLNLSTNRRTSDGTISDSARSAAFINVISDAGPSGIAFATASAINTQPAIRAFIDGAGRVGIGTSTPGAKLEVRDSSDVASKVVKTGVGYLDVGVDSVNHITFGNQPLAFRYLTSEVARIDQSGRLLVGTSSASANVLGSTNIGPLFLIEQPSASASAGIIRTSNNTNGSALVLAKSRGASAAIVSSGDQLGNIEFVGADGVDFGSTAAKIEAFVDGTPGTDDMPGRLVFSTTADGASSPTERMRIGSSGNIGIGQADLAGSRVSVTATGSQYAGYFTYVGATGQGIGISSTGANTAYPLYFFNNGTLVGSVYTTSSSTAYNTSSDYRLKENVTAVTDGITRLQQLKPSRFNFIADPDTVVDGFIAHEVQSVVPEAITGEKDAVDDEGNPQYQGIDQSKLVPLLTAALQEAIGEIESLKARVAALESA